MTTRLSQTVRFGPFRLRVSVPLNGKRGRVWVSAGTRTGRRGWASVSKPVGRQQRRSH